MSDQSIGTLWVVATPIGNLADLSQRAIATLKDVAVIAAEDTRHTRPLLDHHGIATPTTALHEYNERAAVDAVLERLRGGDDVALVSDAGTPLVSDPGFRLVRAARQAGVTVSPIPGACAAIAALSVGAMPSDRFVFEGFLPSKAAARKTRLEELAGESRTLIFYESSHRIMAGLTAMRDVFGHDREASVCRELTKRFETVLHGSLGDLVEQVSSDANQRRGEFVVLVAGVEVSEDAKVVEGQRIFAILANELPPAKAAKLAAAISGAPRRAVYAAS